MFLIVSDSCCSSSSWWLRPSRPGFRAVAATLLAGFLVLGTGTGASSDQGCPTASRSQIDGIEVICLAAQDLGAGSLARPTQGSDPRAQGEPRSAFSSDSEAAAERPGSRAPLDLTVNIAQASESPVENGEDSGAGEDYHIGPGDQLRILVWRQPELSTAATVGPDGRLTVPLVEDLMVSGQTSSEVARAIEGQLGRFIQDPFVNVIVESFNGTFAQQIRVIGKAVTPRAIAFRDGLTVLDVMIAVGGLSPFADGNGAIIVRRSGDTSREIALRLDDLLEDGDATANVKMEPGDVVVIPEGFFNGDWRISQFASFNQEYSDNINREPEGDEGAALVTEIGPAWEVSITTSRINAALRSSSLARKQSLTDSSLELRNELDATTTIEFLENLFFLDASATSSRQTIDTTTTGGESDQDQVTSYSISPYLVNHFGSFADSEFRLTFAETIVDAETASDDSTASASFLVSSGRDFNNLFWSLSANTSRTSRSEEDDDISETSLSANGEYAISRYFSLVGSVGYQIRDDTGTDNDVDDPTWEIGFDWRPSPRTDVRMTYGQRDGDTSVRANINHRLSPRSSVAITYSEELETSQERLQSDLAALSIDPETGNLIDARDRGVFDSNTSPFSIEDETTRTRRLSLQFNHAKRRNSYSLGFQGEDQSTGDGTTTERNLNLSASWTRRLNPRATLNVSGSVERSEFVEEDSIDTDLELNTSLGYRLFTDVSGSLSYSHARRFSELETDEFVENLFQLGLDIRF